MNENEKKIDGVETPVEDTAVQQPAEPKKSGKKAFAKAIHGKNFKYGSMATIITVVVIVLTILINVGATALVNRYPSLKLDMSTGAKMSLSKDLTETVDTIQHKTEIIFCTTKDNYETTFNNYLAQQIGMEAMNEGTRITTLAEKAAEYGKAYAEHVKLIDALCFADGVYSDYDENAARASGLIGSAGLLPYFYGRWHLLNQKSCPVLLQKPRHQCLPG